MWGRASGREGRNWEELGGTETNSDQNMLYEKNFSIEKKDREMNRSEVQYICVKMSA